jgi:hypothetical protein
MVDGAGHNVPVGPLTTGSNTHVGSIPPLARATAYTVTATYAQPCSDTNSVDVIGSFVTAP